MAAAQQNVKEWSHEFLEIARHRRAAFRCAICHLGTGHPAYRRTRISEEIVVTAQKRATALQEVPFSIAAVTNEDLEQSGATNIVDVARNIPGLYITDLGPGQSQVAIRGISAGQVVRDQPGVKESVGIYLDESPISVALFTPDLDLYDLDRIEVLRGPQGTLYGAGSDAGTVRYITAQPDIGTFGGSAEVVAEYAHRWRNGWLAARRHQCADRRNRGHARWSAITTNCRDSSIRCIPAANTREDVNGGSRTGGRSRSASSRTKISSITPRIVYQKLETDGYPRIDQYNILGNPYHHHRACRGSGRARPGHAVPRRHRR